MSALVVRGAVAVVDGVGGVHTGDVVSVDGVIVTGAAPEGAMVVDATGGVVTGGARYSHPTPLRSRVPDQSRTHSVPI